MTLSHTTHAITIHYDTSFNGNGYQEVDLAYGTNLLLGSVTIEHTNGNSSSDILHWSGWTINTPANGKIVEATLSSNGNFTAAADVHGAVDEFGNPIAWPENVITLFKSTYIDLLTHAYYSRLLGKNKNGNSIFDKGENLFGGSILFYPSEFYSADPPTNYYFMNYSLLIKVSTVEEPLNFSWLIPCLVIMLRRAKRAKTRS